MPSQSIRGGWCVGFSDWFDCMNNICLEPVGPLWLFDAFSAARVRYVSYLDHYYTVIESPIMAESGDFRRSRGIDRSHP